jgi:hypothetical protein
MIDNSKEKVAVVSIEIPNNHNNKNKVVMLNNIKWDRWDLMINTLLKILTVNSYNNHQAIKYK